MERLGSANLNTPPLLLTLPSLRIPRSIARLVPVSSLPTRVRCLPVRTRSPGRRRSLDLHSPRRVWRSLSALLLHGTRCGCRGRACRLHRSRRSRRHRRSRRYHAPCRAKSHEHIAARTSCSSGICCSRARHRGPHTPAPARALIRRRPAVARAKPLVPRLTTAGLAAPSVNTGRAAAARALRPWHLASLFACTGHARLPRVCPPDSSSASVPSRLDPLRPEPLRRPLLPPTGVPEAPGLSATHAQP